MTGLRWASVWLFGASACSLLENPSQFEGAGGAGLDAGTGAVADAGPDAPDGAAADAPDDAPVADAPDMDGADGNALPGTILWARSASTLFLYGIAEGAGGVYISGVLRSPASLGGTPIVPVGASDAALAQYGSADGSYLYSSRFGGGSPSGSGTVYAYLDMLDNTAAPIIPGAATCSATGTPACNTIDVGLGQQAPGGGAFADGFVGRYNVSDGKPTWVDRLVGPGNDFLVSTTPGPMYGAYVAGWYDQSTTFSDNMGTHPVTNAGDRDVFLAQINSTNGQTNFVRSYADASFEEPQAIVWTGSNLIMTGTVAGVGVTAFGPPTLTTQGFDFFVTKLAPDGTPIWWEPLGGPGDDKFPNITVDAAGDIYLTGTIAQTEMFGTFSVGGAGGNDVVVAKLSGTDGTVVWATSFGSAMDDAAQGIAVDTSGHVLVTAGVAGAIAPNGPWNGDIDAALVCYDTTGKMLWSKIIGTSGTDGGGNVTAGSTGDFYVNITLGGDIGPAIEDVTIQGAPQPSGIILKIAP